MESQIASDPRKQRGDVTKKFDVGREISKVIKGPSKGPCLRTWDYQTGQELGPWRQRVSLFSVGEKWLGSVSV